MSSATNDAHQISDLAALEAIYGEALPRSLTKEIDYISEHYRAYIEHSPFIVIASVSPDGTDCSPRGDPAGFVHVADSKTVLIPDRRGNNRIDTLRNIVRDPRVSLLFLIPGIGETLRINGRAYITVEPTLIQQFSMNGRLPRSVIRVHVDAVYFQCQKALARSKLWNHQAHVARDALPTAGAILQALSGTPFDGTEYDRDYPERMHETMY